MNIAIVDDTPTDREAIQSYLNCYLKTVNKNANVTYFESGRSFLEKVELSKLQVVFLDIFIGDITGIELAEKIREINSKCLIILCSVSKEFIHASYDLGALYYLIKPYDYETFLKVMQRVEGQAESPAHYIEVMANRKKTKVNIDDILYVDKEGNSVRLHLKNEVLKVWSQTFAEVQDTLLSHPQYIKCFQCILINMKHAVKTNGRDFELENGESIPISRDSAIEVQDKYTRYVFNNTFGGE